MKQRLDIALVTRGLAPTRSQARDLVKRGLVRLADAVASKAGLEVDDDALIEVAPGAQPYVSRAGLKLAAALDHFGLSPRGLIVPDLGASTGGFTQVLLERGAERVYAIDVGHGQLSPLVAADPRVISREGLDARKLSAEHVPEPVGAIVADLSFISLTLALAPALALATPGAWLVALIKPQFEAGRAEIARGGIVKSEGARQRAVEKVQTWLATQRGWHVLGTFDSPITGGDGNAEVLIGARHVG